MNKELVLMDKQKKKKQFLEMETTPGEDAVKTVKLTRNNLKYYRT